MKVICPNIICRNQTFISKDGYYRRACDSKRVQRFRCQLCGKRFSSSTGRFDYRIKKRRELTMLEHLICSKMSQTRAASVLKMNRKTVASLMLVLDRKAVIKQIDLLRKLEADKVEYLQFDDLITVEHTKMKPLSISIAVDAKRRYILGAEVSRIPASGPLAKKSVAKYGRRTNDHEKGLKRLFEKISSSISETALVQSDNHKRYPKYVKKYLSGRNYRTYYGGRSCVAGQGELKKKFFDPLFTLNHTCAMFRDNINRLVRKTWCTTKKIEWLQMHVNIYVAYYNYRYLGVNLNTT